MDDLQKRIKSAIKKKNYGAALEDINLALSVSPTPDLYFYKAYVLGETNTNIPECISIYSSLYEKSKEIKHLLGICRILDKKEKLDENEIYFYIELNKNDIKSIRRIQNNKRILEFFKYDITKFFLHLIEILEDQVKDIDNYLKNNRLEENNGDCFESLNLETSKLKILKKCDDEKEKIHPLFLSYDYNEELEFLYDKEISLFKNTDIDNVNLYGEDVIKKNRESILSRKSLEFVVKKDFFEYIMFMIAKLYYFYDLNLLQKVNSFLAFLHVKILENSDEYMKINNIASEKESKYLEENHKFIIKLLENNYFRTKNENKYVHFSETILQLYDNIDTNMLHNFVFKNSVQLILFFHDFGSTTDMILNPNYYFDKSNFFPDQYLFSDSVSILCKKFYDNQSLKRYYTDLEKKYIEEYFKKEEISIENKIAHNKSKTSVDLNLYIPKNKFSFEKYNEFMFYKCKNFFDKGEIELCYKNIKNIMCFNYETLKMTLFCMNILKENLGNLNDYLYKFCFKHKLSVISTKFDNYESFFEILLQENNKNTDLNCTKKMIVINKNSDIHFLTILKNIIWILINNREYNKASNLIKFLPKDDSYFFLFKGIFMKNTNGSEMYNNYNKNCNSEYALYIKIEEYMKNSIKIDNKNYLAHEYLADFYFLTKKYKLSLTHFLLARKIRINKIGKIDKTVKSEDHFLYMDFEIVMKTAKCLQILGKVNESINFLENNERKCLNYFYELGKAYFSRKKYVEAEKKLTEAMKLLGDKENKYSFNIFYMLGKSCIQNNKIEHGLLFFDRCKYFCLGICIEKAKVFNNIKQHEKSIIEANIFIYTVNEKNKMNNINYNESESCKQKIIYNRKNNDNEQILEDNYQDYNKRNFCLNKNLILEADYNEKETSPNFEMFRKNNLSNLNDIELLETAYYEKLKALIGILRAGKDTREEIEKLFALTYNKLNIYIQYLKYEYYTILEIFTRKIFDKTLPTNLKTKNTSMIKINYIHQVQSNLKYDDNNLHIISALKFYKEGKIDEAKIFLEKSKIEGSIDLEIYILQMILYGEKRYNNYLECILEFYSPILFNFFIYSLEKSFFYRSEIPNLEVVIDILKNILKKEYSENNIFKDECFKVKSNNSNDNTKNNYSLISDPTSEKNFSINKSEDMRNYSNIIEKTANEINQCEKLDKIEDILQDLDLKTLRKKEDLKIVNESLAICLLLLGRVDEAIEINKNYIFIEKVKEYKNYFDSFIFVQQNKFHEAYECLKKLPLDFQSKISNYISVIDLCQRRLLED